MNHSVCDRCFACGRPIRGVVRKLADTRDGQIVFVGYDCAGKVLAAGDVGYQPSQGGPRLYSAVGYFYDPIIREIVARRSP